VFGTLIVVLGAAGLFVQACALGLAVGVVVGAAGSLQMCVRTHACQHEHCMRAWACECMRACAFACTRT
jgi:hypothetical protein